MTEDEIRPEKLNELSLEKLIEFGAVIAQTDTNEAWSIIDSDYIPAIQTRTGTADQKTLNSAYDKLNKYLDSDESAKRDYAGTVAGAIFRSVPVFDRSPAANRLIIKLKRVASDDAEIFPRFRASIALVEAEKRCEDKLELDYEALMGNITTAVTSDRNLQKVSDEPLAYLAKK